MSFITRFFQPEPPAPALTDEAQIQKLYRSLRIRTFLTIYFGYVVFYITRKNLSSALHIFSEQLGIDIIDLGIITGTFSLVYGVGKIFTGVLADRTSARKLIAAGLFLAGFINLFYSYLTSLWLLTICWAVNGICQASGYPPIARTLTQWFSPRERAKIWGWWHTCQMVGTFLTGLISALILKYSPDWHALFYIPGMISIVYACYLFWSLKDSPQQVGLPPIAQFRNEATVSTPRKSGNQWFIIKKYILCNPYIWCLCIAACAMQMVRFSTLDWATKFLYEARHVGKVQAVWLWNLAPLLGMPGGLVGGYLISRFFKGFCSVVLLGYLLCLMGSLYGYIIFAGQAHLYLTMLLMGLISFFFDGAIVFIDVILLRLIIPESVGTVSGFSGGMAYILGTAIGANFVATYLIAHYGWNALYYVCIGCVALAFLLVLCCARKEYQTNFN